MTETADSRQRRRWTGSRAGFVLVGGRSSRMGSDKALLPYGDNVLVSHISREVESAAGRVMLVGPPRKYGYLGLPVIPDMYTGFGPMGAVATVLRNGLADWNLIVACDMPGVNLDLFERLFASANQISIDCVAPITLDGQVHPLCAVYNKRAIRGIERALSQGIRSLCETLQFLSTRQVRIDDPEALKNVNTPFDWGEAAANAAESEQPEEPVAQAAEGQDAPG